MESGLCKLLGIEHPIIQAGMSLFTSGELVCAVSNAGGLGSLGCWRRQLDDFNRQMAVTRARTNRPFAPIFAPGNQHERIGTRDCFFG